jgi:dTDP-4-amino-4,6-dideoxygalactose transaminase
MNATQSELRLAFIDLAAQQAIVRGRIDAAIARVLDHGHYIMGPEVDELEHRLAAATGAKHAITCANGTDALALALMALDVGPGDAVLVPAFTFTATAEVVPLLGAVPVFVDVLEDTFNLDPDGLKQGVDAARQLGLRPVGVISVDLFGQPADYDAIAMVAAAHGLWLVGDAAQSLGASYRGRNVGQLARLTTTSFFPAKPLGCYGDGGAIFCDDDDLAATIRSLRVHGQGTNKYDTVRIGMNSRLDTLQAAILLEKLEIFPEEIRARQRVAALYAEGLADVIVVPQLLPGVSSVWAQYTIRTPHRGTLADRLKAKGIPTAVYYPVPLHRLPAFRSYPQAAERLPVAEALAGVALSLPMHPYLERRVQDRIVTAVRSSHG